MFSNILGAILTDLAIQLPVLIVMLVGIVIALATWKCNPKPSLFALISILIFFVVIILNSVIVYLPILLWENPNYSLRTTIMIISHVVLNVIRGGAWGLLLAAVFSGRKQKAE